MKKIFMLISLLFSCSLAAQWNTDTAINTLVADSASEDMQAIGTSDGQTYIVFWKSVPAPTNYEIRLQVLDATGNRKLGDDGILVSNSVPMGTYTVTWSIAVDADDNLYLGVTGTTDDSGHVFKMDIDGNHLWGTDGISIGTGLAVNVLPLTSGETIVAWFPEAQGLMQKFDANGNAIWNTPQTIESGNSATIPANLFELSDGGYIVVFHVLGFGINSTLYAQRYDGEGVAQWATPTQLSNKTTAFNTQYSGTQDGDSIFYGYVGKSSNRFDSYVLKLNPDGTLPWGINGMDFNVSQTDFEMDTRIVTAPGSPYIYAISTYTNTSQNESGEFIQKFDKESGARQFTDNGKSVYPISANFNEHASPLYLLNDQPLFLLKSGFDNGATPVTLSAVLLDENGDFAWTEESKPMATYGANKGRTHLTNPVNGQLVALWIEDKTTGPKIYAQNLTDEPTNIISIEDKYDLKVFPNPSNENVYFDFYSPISTKAQLIVTNSLGNIVVITDEQIKTGKNSIKLDIQHLSAGTYNYQIEGKELKLFGNLIKTK